MKININKITKIQLFDWMFEYTNLNGIVLEIDKNSKRTNISYSLQHDNLISINSKWEKKSLPFVLFHELGHFEIWKRGLFKKLENDRFLSLRIEQWCDIYGEKESSKYFINHRCYKPYYLIEGKNFIKNYNKQQLINNIK